MLISFLRLYFYKFPSLYYRWFETPVVNEAIFDSNIDDVRFYSEAFTHSEVQSDMAERFPIRNADTGLIAAYDFATMSADGVFEDISGHNHGAVTHVTDSYAFPAIDENLQLHQVCDESKGRLIVERFTGGSAVTVEQDYMASKNEDFRVSAEPAEGYELACILVNGHPVDNNTYIRTAIATEVEARFRRVDAANIYIVGDRLSDGAINPDYRFEPTGNPGEYTIWLPELKGNFWFEVTDEPVERASTAASTVLDAHTDHLNPQNVGVATDELMKVHKLKYSVDHTNPFAPLGDPSTGFHNVNISLFYNPLENVRHFTFTGLATGIEEIDADAFAQPEYYTVQGVRVSAESLTPGIYIVRRGNTTFKIAVR